MKNNFSLKGKVIVVTGATGILGEAFVNAIADAGGIVGVLGRNEKIANERVATIVNQGGDGIALIADVTNEQDLINAREKIVAKYGKIDGLVNAAGGNIPDAIIEPEEDIFQLNMSALREVMHLNLFGTKLFLIVTM
jgi:NAD(P)-dependent dehydrogenase (short-subunit alcohol dehydrogenase family)